MVTLKTQEQGYRGYLYQVKTNTNYKCHNCGASMSFNNFIKQIDPTLHKQYTMEKFKEGYTGKNFVVEEPKLEFKKPVFKKELDLPRASEVPIAKEYLEKRMLDPTKFYFAKKFRTWVNSKKRTFDSVEKDESRIIIPMYDTERNLIGFQGKSKFNFVKYITVMLNDDAPKVFGLEQIDKTKTVYVTEGPSTQHSLEIALQCAVQTVMFGGGVLAVLYGCMIMSRVVVRFLNESNLPSTEVSVLLSGHKI